MSGAVIAAVLFAALLHASWNAMVKASADTRHAAVLVAAGGALLSACALPFVAAPAPASWLYIAASAALQVLYYALLVATYRAGDISLAYPIMRGSAPLLVALVSGAVLGERLAWTQWLAIGAICGGILTLSIGQGWQFARRMTVYALMTACLIASYTMIDGIGARRSGAPAAYTMWIYLLTGAAYAGWSTWCSPRALAAYARANVHIGLVGGAASLGAYGIALWAMTRAPVAAVAALRECSILFATAIGVLFLRERLAWRRLLAVAMVASGAIFMRIA